MTNPQSRSRLVTIAAGAGTALVAGLLFPVPAMAAVEGESDLVEINLLNINDFHGRIDSNTVKFAGTVEGLRAEYGDENSLFLAAGDSIGASLFASATQGDIPTLDVLNALEMDASAVGNHEFDQGFDDLTGRVMDAVDFPYLGANVYDAVTGETVLDEYAMFTVGGLDVAVIGAVTEETPTLVSPGGIEGLTFGDPVEAVNRVVEEIGDDADIIVAEFHEGGSNAPMEEQVASGGVVADMVNLIDPAVDAVFMGHTTGPYVWDAPIPGSDSTRPMIHTGSYGSNIGQIVLEVDPETAEVVAYEARNVARVATADEELVAAYPRVAEVKTIVDAALAEAAVIGGAEIGAVTADVTTAFSGGSYVDGVYTPGSYDENGVPQGRDNRAAQSAMGNLVAEALLTTLSDEQVGGAEIAVVNPGGLRAELLYEPDGVVTFAEANAVLPFVNNLWTTTITGAQLTTALEQQWRENGSYLQLGLSENVTYTFDASLPLGERITGVFVDGEAIDPEGTYRIGSFNFLLTGGDAFSAFAEGTDTRDSGLIDRDAWIDYITAASPLSPDFSARGVEVTDLPETVDAGETLSFTVSGLNLTSLGAPEITSLEVSLGGVAYAPVEVVDGSATVELTVPADMSGDQVVVLSTPESGTEAFASVSVTAAPVEPGEPSEPGEPGEPSEPGVPGTPGLPGTGAPGPVADDQLTDDARGGIRVLTEDIVEGGTIAIDVGTQYAGTQVSVWLHSEPVLLGQPTVDRIGQVTATLPEGVTGTHRLVVLDADGDLIGWEYITISDRSDLAATGGDFSVIPMIVVLATLLVAAGLGARVHARRREV